MDFARWTVAEGAAHRFQNQCFLKMKGHSSKGTPLVSTKKNATNTVMTATQPPKKRKVAHCSAKVTSTIISIPYPCDTLYACCTVVTVMPKHAFHMLL